MNVSKVRQALPPAKGFRSSESKWQACCPSHGDKRASLSIEVKEDKILFYCHAGCHYKQILEDAGLEIEDILSEEENRMRRKRLSVIDRILFGFKKSHPNARFIEEYKYRDQEGNYLYSKLRIEWTEADGGKTKITPYYRICGDEYKRI